MKTFVIATAAALLLGSTAISTAQAQDAAGSQQQLPNNPDAPETTPAQQPEAGEANSASQAAPSEQPQSGESTAQGSDPEQMETQDRAGREGEPTPDQSTSGAAPDQAEQPGEMNADKTEPGQPKEDDQATDTTEPSSETTASIDISAEQRTEIRDVIVETKAEPVDIDIEVNVGVAVPRTVTLAPLPPRVIEIVPAYSGYEYFVLADGRVVIVEPATLKVVYILVV